MNEIQTEILINAPAALVWEILVDFPEYGSWNPFIIKLSGEPKLGAGIWFVANVNGVMLPISARILSFEKGLRLSWGGPENPLLRLAASAEHFLTIEETGPEQCRLVHGERMSGIVPDAVWPVLARSKPAYEAMNAALKTRAEAKHRKL